MTFQEIAALLTERFGPEVIENQDGEGPMPRLWVQPDALLETGRFLLEDDRLYFDSLSCLTALDNGPEAGTFELAYNLYSIAFEHALCLKVKLPRQQQPDGSLPEVPSLAGLWRTADWHEREAFDLMGIRFTGHPDLRRILLPEDWQGHPLRRDYTPQQTYHGIRVAY